MNHTKLVRDRQVSSELIESFRSSILEAHETAKLRVEESKKALITSLEAIRAAGVLIQDALANLSQNQFKQATGDFLNDNAVREYLKFLRNHPDKIDETNYVEPAREILATLRIASLLPFPEGHGVQVLHTPSFFQQAANHVMAFVAGFKKFTRLNPLSSWDIDAAETFLFSLKPLLRIHKEVTLHVQKQRDQCSRQ